MYVNIRDSIGVEPWRRMKVRFCSVVCCIDFSFAFRWFMIVSWRLERKQPQTNKHFDIAIKAIWKSICINEVIKIQIYDYASHCWIESTLPIVVRMNLHFIRWSISTGNKRCREFLKKNWFATKLQCCNWSILCRIENVCLRSAHWFIFSVYLLY